jgi:hypothetical protein
LALAAALLWSAAAAAQETGEAAATRETPAGSGVSDAGTTVPEENGEAGADDAEPEDELPLPEPKAKIDW